FLMLSSYVYICISRSAVSADLSFSAARRFPPALAPARKLLHPKLWTHPRTGRAPGSGPDAAFCPPVCLRALTPNVWRPCPARTGVTAHRGPSGPLQFDRFGSHPWPPAAFLSTTNGSPGFWRRSGGLRRYFELV